MTEHFVHPDVRAHLDGLKANPRPKLTVEMLPAVRPKMGEIYAALDPPIGELAVTRDILMPGPGGQIPLRLFDVRESRSPGPVAVFFHGGGFIIGNNDSAAFLCAEIARQLDVPVIYVDTV